MGNILLPGMVVNLGRVQLTRVAATSTHPVPASDPRGGFNLEAPSNPRPHDVTKDGWRA